MTRIGYHITVVLCWIVISFSYCGKKETPAPPPNPTDTTIAPQVDPTLAPTIGFFYGRLGAEEFYHSFFLHSSFVANWCDFYSNDRQK